jgi:hypothetical protein
MGVQAVSMCIYEKCERDAVGTVPITDGQSLTLKAEVCSLHASMLRAGLPIALFFYIDREKDV